MVQPTPAGFDLLAPEPEQRIDRAAARQVLAFAYATGDVGDGFDAVVDRARVGASWFRPDDFAKDVFLSDFARRWLRVTLPGLPPRERAGFATRVVASPPTDLAETRYRQAIFAELVARPELEQDLRRVYVACLKLREQLTSRPIGRAHPVQRRLDILRSIKELVDETARGFGDATSGIGRLRRWAEAWQQTTGYSWLAQLLDYEQNQAELDVRIGFGFDGSIRSFQTLALREQGQNRYRSSLWVRFWTQLWLVLRGYRVSGSEILSRFANEVFSAVEEPLVDVFALFGQVEFYLAGLAFREKARAVGLPVCLPELALDQPRDLRQLWNPLLFDCGSGIVPCDLQSQRQQALTIVTGPNSGGKTRLLQALALAQLCGQAGFFVAAESARLPWARGLFVSMIEHVSADQREGRLGMEMLRIRRLFESVRRGALIVLDELCSGTNPSEGEAMFRLVVELLPELRPEAFITTHFLAFAARLQQSLPGLEFLQVELDDDEVPTFRFVPGVAKTSLAHKTAARLGVTHEALRALILEQAELDRKGPCAPSLDPTSDSEHAPSAR